MNQILCIFVKRLVLVSLLFCGLGCDKPSKNTSTLGPEASPADIQKAQSEAVSQVAPAKIKVGQLAHYTETQELITSEGPITRLLQEWKVEVIAKEVDDNILTFTTLRSIIDHDLDGKPVSVFKDLFSFRGFPSAAQKDVFESKLSIRLMNSDSPAKIEDELFIVSVSFHNLKSQDMTFQPPERVRARPNCLGLKNCRIQGKQITYDVAFQFSDGSIQKHQIEWIISDEVPFFSSILKQCATTLVSVDALRVLVKQCQNAVDFSF